MNKEKILATIMSAPTCDLPEIAAAAIEESMIRGVIGSTELLRQIIDLIEEDWIRAELITALEGWS